MGECMGSIRIVFSDYDNTLSWKGWRGATEFAVSAICQLKAAGVEFAPVSGRPHAEAAMMFRGNESCGETGAYSNGQEVWVRGECVCEKPIMRDDLERVREVADELGDVALGVIIGDVRSLVLVTSHHEFFRSYTASFPWPVGIADTIERASYLKVNVHIAGDHDRRAEVQRILRAEVPTLDFVLPASNAPLLDVLPAGWDKGSAVRLILEALGISRDEAMAFGDSENDLPMLSAVGTPVAVENADAAVKAAACRVVGPCTDEAVAHELLRIAAEAGRRQ